MSKTNVWQSHTSKISLDLNDAEGHPQAALGGATRRITKIQMSKTNVWQSHTSKISLGLNDAEGHPQAALGGATHPSFVIDSSFVISYDLLPYVWGW